MVYVKKKKKIVGRYFFFVVSHGQMQLIIDMERVEFDGALLYN